MPATDTITGSSAARFYRLRHAIESLSEGAQPVVSREALGGDRVRSACSCDTFLESVNWSGGRVVVVCVVLKE